jgi:tyrosyl-tRNA synthetase
MDNKKIEEVLTRGVDGVIDREHLKKQLGSGKKLRIKYGIDPTGANIHIGHAISLLKLRDFQELGHKVVLIVGDFTAEIGDTSDKESERPMTSSTDVKKNMKNYTEQVGKILDMKKVETHYNSEWFKKMNYLEIGAQADQFSLHDFIVRDNIKKRLDAEGRISLREVLYPLMQGYDSVAIKADVELGGTDQRFNMLAGRTLQKYYKQGEQDIMMLDIIPGTDGRKMSKSFGNTINILDEPENKFGKIMSIPDDLIILYFIHCTRRPMEEVIQMEKELKVGANPRDLKLRLAHEIVAMYHSEAEAKKAEENFINTFSKKETPEEIKEVKVKSKNILDVLVEAGICSSKGDARRNVEQGGVSVDGEAVKDFNFEVKKGAVIKKGKRHFIKIKN